MTTIKATDEKENLSLNVPNNNFNSKINQIIDLNYAANGVNLLNS